MGFASKPHVKNVVREIQISLDKRHCFIRQLYQLLKKKLKKIIEKKLKKFINYLFYRLLGISNIITQHKIKVKLSRRYRVKKCLESLNSRNLLLILCSVSTFFLIASLTKITKAQGDRGVHV